MLTRWLYLVLGLVRIQASLYIQGHCDAAVNGVWSPTSENATFQKAELTLGHGLVMRQGTRLASGAMVLGASEWQMWCLSDPWPRNGTMSLTSFNQEIYDLSASLCGERLAFSRITTHLYYAPSLASASAAWYLFFDCSTWQMFAEPPTVPLSDLTCQPPYPSHAGAMCDGSIVNLTLHQEFYPVVGCDDRGEFFPEGRTTSGAPFYRSGAWYLYFDPDCDGAGTSRWMRSASAAPMAGGAAGAGCEGWSGAATGPPLGNSSSCDFVAKENIHLPLDVYQLWALESFSTKLTEKLELCEVAPTPGDFDLDLGYLELMAGPDTLIRRMLIYSRNPQDLEETAKEFDAIFVVAQGWPFAFIFLWLPLAISLLCSAIPRCKCCRCFARERRTKRRMKILLFGLLTLVFVATVVCITMASAGLHTLEEGKLMSHCASSQLMQLVLDGGEGFLGVKPLLQRIEALLQGQEQEAFLSRTERLVQSAELANATLQLLQLTLRDANAVLTGPEGAFTWHRCVFCDQLQPLVTQALQDLAHTVDQSAVATVKALEGNDLHERLSASAATLSQVQRLAMEALPFLYADDGLGRVWTESFGVLVGFIVLLAILLAATLIMGFGSLASFANEPRETGISGAGEYSRRTSLCSCCSWFFFSLMAVMMCSLAGCLVVVYSQIGGFCLELHDQKPELLQSTGLSSEPRQVDAGILDMTRSCLLDGSPDVFALLSSGPSESVRDVMSDFSKGTLTAMPDIEELRSYVRENAVDALLLPSEAAKSNPRYAAMQSDVKTRVGFSSSVSCVDHQPGGQVIPGMDTFFDSFKSMGLAAGSCNSSSQSLRCSELVTSAGKACQAAARFLKTKNTIRKMRFPCHFFSQNGVPCDVKDMTKVNGEWQVCSPTVISQQCTLDEFRQYLMDFDARLSKAFQMLEEEMAADLTDLAILTAAIPGGCETWTVFWQRFFNGLCFVSLPALRLMSMSFLAASGVALGGVFLMYFVWRRAYDNYTRSTTFFRPSKGPVEPGERPAENVRSAVVTISDIRSERSAQSEDTTLHI